MNQDIVFEAKNVSKAFPGVRALNNIKLQIRRGEIHSIIGENGAGKSTLMKIFSGVYPPDAGQILLDGEAVIFRSPFGAIKRGISIIFQEFNLMPELTVAENISIADIPRKGIILDKKVMIQKAQDLIKSIGIRLNPNTLIKDLSVSQCQLVEILRAISNNSKIIIMDEPTAALNNEESDILFDIIRELNNKGTTIIYISHKMKEVFQISDRITVLRDGNLINTFGVDEYEQETVVKMMVGRDVDLSNKFSGQSIGNVIYSVKDFTLPGVFEDINFDLKQGEILGITGLMGCGNIELTKKLYGLIPEGTGKQFLLNKEIFINSPNDAMNKGIAFVTDDRKNSGNFSKMSAKENATISILQKIKARNFLLNLKAEDSLFSEYMEKFKIKCTPNQQMNNLSGGNQQKILVSRALMTNCKILILLEPTRGIDVGAKAQMHQIIQEFAESGIAVIVVSSDLLEVIQLSDRLMVMYEGKSQGFLEGEDINEDTIMLKAAGCKEKNK